MTSPSQGHERRARGVQALLPHDEVERSTIQYLVGTLESVAVLFQAAVLGLSAAIDPYVSPCRTIIGGLAVGHIVAAYVISRTGGPFARGGYLPALWVALAFVVPILGVSMLERGSYAIDVGGTQLGVYVNGPVLIAAFYPWASRARRSLRQVSEALLLLGFAVTPFILIHIFNGNPQRINYISATATFVWVLIAYILGKSVGLLCRTAARRQIEIQQQSYDEFFNFLHSHVKAGVAAIKAEWGNDAAMREKLSELEQAVSDRRIELLLARQQVPLAALISERIRAFVGIIDIIGSPRVGAITVTRPIGILVSRALGDLMKNASIHGGSAVEIRLNATASELVLEVIDDGPGFDPSLVLYDESSSLCRLRHDTEQLRGSLIVRSKEVVGTQVRLTVPMRSIIQQGSPG